jgi:hypothetical protein
MNSNTIIRRPDGSIDIEFYLKRGRLIRSRKAGSFLHRLRQCLASGIAGGQALWCSQAHHPRD